MPPVKEQPQLNFQENNRKSATENELFVAEQISELLQSGAIAEGEKSETIRINPLSVAKGKKLRLILDLSDLNKNLEKHHVKFEDIAKIKNILPRHGFMTCFDLKSGYHHLLIHQAFRNYLGFKWRGKIYVFNVLPFGLSSAPFIFTKLFRPLLARWRGRGLGVAIYLDDGLIWGKNIEECKITSLIIRKDLEEAGFFVATEKCVWHPCQKLTWLGHNINLEDMSLDITQERKDRAYSCLAYLLRSRGPSLRERLRWLGFLASMFLVIPRDLTKRRRVMVTEVAQRVASGCRQAFRWPMSEEERRETEGWFEILRGSKTDLQDVCRSFDDYFVIATDASNIGVGAVFHTSKGDNLISRSDLPDHLQGTSSTVRELYGILHAIKSFANMIAGEKVQIQTDSQTAQSVFYRGSTKSHVQQLASLIWETLDALKTQAEVYWIPRELNYEADLASRIKDMDNWSISDSIFNHLNSIWGPFEVDMFADEVNRKCGVFVSRWFNEGSAAVNAFSGSATKFWRQYHCWWVPPAYLIVDTILMARKHLSKGVIGFPLWPSHTSFMCLRNGSEWIPEIKDTFIVPKGGPLIKEGSSSFTFKSPSVEFDFVFAKINFRE
ncbi:ribonuclease HI [Oesophagostomum dentatum]|uniref:Ribonuclease HI n=1 Tax=Oesophagostomum dentatum TaxID=61180 RepID=A0A0B1S9B3_OESDE|nr:ribonuclease HI [Oesophagostomum dentatum]